MFTRPKTRDNFHPENWPDLAVVSHNDELQHLMKQRTYIITSLMRQLTAGGGKRSRINSMEGWMDEKEGREDHSHLPNTLGCPAFVCLFDF